MIRFLPYSFFDWCTKTWLATVISNSKWDFAVLETFHIVGATVLLGSIVILNLRILGLGVRQPAWKLAREVGPWGLGGLALMIASGVPMFMSAALTYASSIPFATKMCLLLCAIALQFGIHKSSKMYEGTVPGKLLAGVALLCWFGVAYSGRGIAFDVLFGT
jgi:Family of unknown function (DUF6644)